MNLTHLALRGDMKGQGELAESMRARFTSCSVYNLENMSYVDALKTAKAKLQHIPRKSMTPALSSYLDRYINYLSPGVVIGVPVEMRSKVQSYVDAVMEGRLSKLEGRVTVPRLF